MSHNPLFGTSVRSSGNNLSNFNRKSDIFLSNMRNRDVHDSDYKEREIDCEEEDFSQEQKEMKHRSRHSRQQIWNRLLTDRKEKEIVLDEFKSLKDQSEFEEKCSFRPEINQNSKIISEFKRENGLEKYDNLEDKLYEDAFDRLQKKEQLKILKMEEEMQGHTFKPNINQGGPNHMHVHFNKDDRPIHERYKDVQIFKEEMLQKLRNKFMDEKNLTFQPKISKISDKVASFKNQGKPVLDRLFDEAEELQRKKMELIHLANEENAKTCTFQPDVNYEGNLHILKNSEMRAEYEEDFLSRQEIFNNYKNENIQKLRQKINKKEFP